MRAPPRPHDFAKLFAAWASLDRSPRDFQCRDNMRNVVAEIIDPGRLAAAFVLSIVECDDDHIHGLEHITGNAERLDKLQRLRFDLESQATHQ